MINFAGIRIGHATHPQHATGCTVFLCPEGTYGSVDARGPAPGSRELALLAPDKPDDKQVNAVLLTGGSAFGLAAADGVMRYLAERGIGHPTPVRPVPIVPAAVVFDRRFRRQLCLLPPPGAGQWQFPDGRRLQPPQHRTR